MISWALATNDGFAVIYKQPFLKSRGRKLTTFIFFLKIANGGFKKIASSLK